MFRELDPLLHSQLRLAIISLLVGLDEADFVYLKERTEATAGYLEVEKGFEGKRPRTVCRITAQGRTAFAQYVDALKDYISK